uniref:Uncharacterized protein n=1 Tax=Anguilla anguilla TaxID=7936 RepID=A0A0E9WBI2_ANGAN
MWKPSFTYSSSQVKVCDHPKLHASFYAFSCSTAFSLCAFHIERIDSF